MTALDTTNLRSTFTAPASSVYVRMAGNIISPSTASQLLFGVVESSTVRFRKSPRGAFNDTVGVTGRVAAEACGLITGLTPGSSYTFDAAYGVEIIGNAAGGLKYGGPNDTTLDNSAGAIMFEIWDPTYRAPTNFLSF